MNKNDKALEVFIKLKYFPIELTDEYYSRLPPEVVREYQNSATHDTLELILTVNTPNPTYIAIVEDLLFKLLSDYHQLHGYDYNENGEIT